MNPTSRPTDTPDAPAKEAVAGTPNSPLADRVYGLILSQILSRALEIGARLPSENTYCQMFSVSRPVVRIAIARLSADGIVERKRGSGTYLKRRPSRRLSDFAQPEDLSGLLKCIEFRIELEGAIAEFAAQRRTSDQIKAISKAFSRLRSEASADFITPESDIAFHLEIAAATGNAFFIDAMRSVEPQAVHLMAVSLGMTKTSDRARVQQVVDEHTEIYEAIVAGDPVLAKAAMRLHLARSRRRITDYTQDRRS